MADVSTISIEELSGARRLIELHGGGLPHKPTDWSGKQQLKTTWYSGNPRASQQVLGPQETPSTWSGKWSRVKLSRTPAIVQDEGSRARVVRPDLLMGVVEDIKASGSLLRVTWATNADGSDVSIVREGRLETIKWSVDTIYDIGWEFMFTWVGKAGSDGRRVVSTRDDSSSDTVALMSALNDMVDTLVGLNIAIGNQFKTPTASSFSLGQLEALAKYPLGVVNAFLAKAQSLVASVAQVGNIIATVGNEPYAVANMFVEFAHNTVAQAHATMDQLTATPPELMSAKSNAIDTLRAAKVFGQSVETQQRLASVAYDLEVKARIHVSSNPGGPVPTYTAGSPFKGQGILNTYETKRGDTPLTVSMMFYGSPDYVLGLLQANHLPWWTVNFEVGKVLLIPRLPPKKGG